MEILLVICAYIVITKPSAIVISHLLNRWDVEVQHATALPNGGRIIGYLERILILSFVLVGEFVGVGFVLAAKSIFRFSEISSGSVVRTEYFIIGTFLSVTISLLVGVILRVYLQ